jgi:hypothetical protein
MSTEEGQTLSKKVWEGFKGWRDEPKYEKINKKQRAERKVEIEMMQDQAIPEAAPLVNKYESNGPLLAPNQESHEYEIPNSVELPEITKLVRNPSVVSGPQGSMYKAAD